MTVNGWKWLEMTKNGLKWLQITSFERILLVLQVCIFPDKAEVG